MIEYIDDEITWIKLHAPRTDKRRTFLLFLSKN